MASWQSLMAFFTVCRRDELSTAELPRAPRAWFSLLQDILRLVSLLKFCQGIQMRFGFFRPSVAPDRFLRYAAGGFQAKMQRQISFGENGERGLQSVTDNNSSACIGSG